MRAPGFIRSAWTGAILYLASIVWEAFWLVGPLIGVEAEDRVTYLLWGLFALVVSSTQAFISLSKENSELKVRLRPKARLMFDDTENTVFVQRGNVGGSPQVLYRIGVVNLASVQIDGLRVVLESAEPHEGHVTYPNSPLKVHRGVDAADGVFSLPVGDGVSPGVYVEVLDEFHFPHLNTDEMGGHYPDFDRLTPEIRIRYASPMLCDPHYKSVFRKLSRFPNVLTFRLEGNIPVSHLRLRVARQDGGFVVRQTD